MAGDEKAVAVTVGIKGQQRQLSAAHLMVAAGRRPNTGALGLDVAGTQDGGIAAGNALHGERRQVDHRVIPRAIFIDPQVGVPGLTDEEANERG